MKGSIPELRLKSEREIQWISYAMDHPSLRVLMEEAKKIINELVLNVTLLRAG